MSNWFSQINQLLLETGCQGYSDKDNRNHQINPGYIPNLIFLQSISHKTVSQLRNRRL